MTGTRSLSIIIPAHNAGSTLKQCLDSVRASTVPVEVVVVDDGSTDDTECIARQAEANGPLKFIRYEQNRGPAAARNIGARAAHGDILFFLDADIVMPRDTAERILREFEQEPAPDALFGSYQKDTAPQNFVSVYKNLLHHYTHQISSAEAATFCGGYGAVRREIFCALGGFDETYFALEDIEFGYRLHNAGYRIRLVKDLQFTHLKKYTLKGLLRSDIKNRAIPWTQLMLKHRIFRNDLNTKSNNVLSVVISYILLLAPLWAWFVPLGWWAATALLVLFVALNFDFLAFVTRERGLWFGAEAVAMTWFNYVYSGAGLLVGVGAYFSESLRRERV